MKLREYLYIVLFSLFLVACSKDSSITDSNKKNEDGVSLHKDQMVFGYMVPNNIEFASCINQLTPSNSGWKGICNEAKWDNGGILTERWNAISNGQFNLVIATLEREWVRNALGTSDTNGVISHLDSLAGRHGTYVVIDDFLTNGVRHRQNESAPHPTFTKDQIDWFCEKAHERNLLVAVTEDCVSVYLSGEINTPEHKALYTNIDCIMPYGYDDYTTVADYQWVDGLMYNHLYNFYTYINDTIKPIGRTKKMFPVLGYNTDYGTSQLGTGSGGYDFIGRALNFASQGIIFYWYDGGSSNLFTLTTYLQNNGYIW